MHQRNDMPSLPPFLSLPLLLLAALSLPARAQTVVLSAAWPRTPVGWQSVYSQPARDTLRLDLNGDGQPDVQFSNLAPASGPGNRVTDFSLALLDSAQELAAGADYCPDIPARYQVGDSIQPPRWVSQRNIAPGCPNWLAWTLTGSGGTSTHGLFRDLRPGYVVLRRRVPTGRQYTWLRIVPDTVLPGGSAHYRYLSAYGQQTFSVNGLPSALPAMPLRIYPTATVDYWKLVVPAGGHYELLDALGRVCAHGECRTDETRIAAAGLRPGTYWLHYWQSGAGRPRRVALLRQ